MANVFPKTLMFPSLIKLVMPTTLNMTSLLFYADSPFILSIFTDKEGYDKITSIADDVYGILNNDTKLLKMMQAKG